MIKLNENAHVSTENGWQIFEKVYDAKQSINSGSNYLLGNGYLGYRGTFAENTKEDYTACIVTDTFDMADDKWRELCNVPNGLYTSLTSNGVSYTLDVTGYSDYEKRLDFKKALLKRKTTYKDGVSLNTEKFSSMHEKHLLAMSYEVNNLKKKSITMNTGIDGDVWSINGDHFQLKETFIEDDFFISHVKTKEYGTDIYVVEHHNFSHDASEEKVNQEKASIFKSLSFDLEANETFTLTKYVAIYTSNDSDQPKEDAIQLIKNSLKKGYDKNKEEHIEAWHDLWQAYDIKINGNIEAQTLTRFNLYHNIIATPRHKKHPIGARGLSCQAYQGAAFWDQEIFNMPMFLYSTPEVARNILEYRYDTIYGARKKAKDLGYDGAFYAWISGKTGEELCPDYFFKNVLTGRKIRNHFNIWQIHISPDITYAISKYYQATEDWEFIENFGAEIVFDVAKFIESRVHYNDFKGYYEVIRVLGPDEWHENVDNNTFTNYQCKFALEQALEFYERFKDKNSEELASLMNDLNISKERIEKWQIIAEKIFIHEPDQETLLIEQFDGFFKLEDITPEKLSNRLIDDEEYWGWPNGIAVATQVSKQADLVQLLVMHDHLYDEAIVKNNYYYYEKRCKHGSSLSPAMHAIIASRIGDETEALKYFYTSSTVDLFNTNEAVVGGTFIGGIHTAAAGAVWQVLVHGFSGISFQEDSIEINPRIPEAFDSLEFNITYKNQHFHLKVFNDIVFIESLKNNTRDLDFVINGSKHIIRKHSSNKIPS
jgi:kojibiose phosphorylase